MKKGLFAFLLTFMLGIFTVSAQVENPAQWSYSQKSLGNNEYELVFKAALEPGWHIYSMYKPEKGSNWLEKQQRTNPKKNMTMYSVWTFGRSNLNMSLLKKLK